MKIYEGKLKMKDKMEKYEEVSKFECSKNHIFENSTRNLLNNNTRCKS
jgi:hypothetical protein